MVAPWVDFIATRPPPTSLSQTWTGPCRNHVVPVMLDLGRHVTCWKGSFRAYGSFVISPTSTTYDVELVPVIFPLFSSSSRLFLFFPVSFSFWATEVKWAIATTATTTTEPGIWAFGGNRGLFSDTQKTKLLLTHIPRSHTIAATTDTTKRSDLGVFV